MKIPDLHEERKYAILKWRAVHNLLHSKEQQLSFYRQRIKEMEDKLSLVSREEVNALYEENERLTDYIQELEDKVK